MGVNHDSENLTCPWNDPAGPLELCLPCTCPERTPTLVQEALRIVASITQEAPLCSNCKFWVAWPTDGQCRKRAPVLVNLSMWPTTNGDDVCGDHEFKSQEHSDGN